MSHPLPILSIDDVLDAGEKYIKRGQLSIVKRAYLLAEAAHKGQTRKTGEEYIQHPLHVCMTLVGLRMDPATLAAAFLHDVVEDTPNSLAAIRLRFGWRIGQLVDGVTKLDQIEEKRSFLGTIWKRSVAPKSQSERRLESLRKMLLATSKDIRVVLIKLADRLHNMETLRGMPQARQKEIAQETLLIYAPIAYRLGISTIKGRLEDLAFSYLSPEAYLKLVRKVKHETANREQQVEKVRRFLHRVLAKEDIEANIHARVKHLYSLHRKLQRYGDDIAKIYDLVACRVIVKSIEECYKVLGLIHQRWKPIEGRVKDYIASPKPNGYRSIHTTVKATGNRPIEIQIRTAAMHEQAEFGVAAHWYYSEQKGMDNYLRRLPNFAKHQELLWVAQLAKWQRKAGSYEDIDQLMRIDFFGDRIFAYTPNGEVIDLPLGATPIDFAYAIHTDIGNHLSGAKANGKMIRLKDELRSGDVVEVIAQKKSSPKADWLSGAKTNLAKEHIRRALRLANG